MIWDKAELDPAQVREAARRYGLDLISASILLRRGYTEESLPYLFGTDLRLLHNPFLFRDMGKAVERIRRAVQDQEPIHIFGDRDVDGITSTILLHEVLRNRGAKVQWQIPVGQDDYGLTMEVVESAAAASCRLLITVDCGASNAAEVTRAAALGIDTIVLDHHNPPAAATPFPETVSLVNPKGDEPDYPFRDLAGCGVVAKLALALAIADSPLYGHPEWLLHAQPGNGTCTLRALRMLDLRCVEQLTDVLPHGPDSLRRSRLYRELGGQTVLVHGLADQERLLAAVGGPCGLKLQDLEPEAARLFPELAGKSLLRLRESDWLPPPRPAEEWQVLSALYSAVAWKKYGLEQALEPVLDLAALGTIADLMPLVDENKLIVRRGLAVMNRMGRPGLRELFVRQNLHGRRVTAKDISWQIAPILNSAGRMGEPQRAAELFLEQNGEEVERLIDYIVELNRQRKALGDKLWDGCFPQAKSSLESSGGKLVFVHGPQIPRGITGILASRLVGFFKVPALVLSEGQVKAVGSLRSPYPVNGFLDRFAELLQNYGGHDRAAGFNLEPARCRDFERRFFEVAREYVPPEAGEPKLLIDAEVPPAYLNPELIKVVERFEPYGEGCPPLAFLTRGVQVQSVEVIGRRELAHLRLLLRADRFRWPAVYWNAAERAGRDFEVNDWVDVVFRLNRNYFLNTETLQLTILDLNRCAPS